MSLKYIINIFHALEVQQASKYQNNILWEKEKQSSFFCYIKYKEGQEILWKSVFSKIIMMHEEKRSYHPS